MSLIGQYLALPQEVISELSEGTLLFKDIDRNAYGMLDIDRSWEGIHFLLCDTDYNGTPPEGYVVPLLNDQSLKIPDFSTFYLKDDQVQEAAAYLDTLTTEQLRAKYSSERFVKEKIYPLFEGADAEGFWDYLISHLTEIQKFYRIAASKGQGIVFYIV
ncbi:YfbM family protein [Paenibacillus xylanexedens]|uniref:YfbM family protein n=1 Tax=Paenibacillus xylanexedens TaxID=528191 RepID=UPI0011AA31CB|nr:YfbM family protein [Paenibacillus xylanexedens]